MVRHLRRLALFLLLMLAAAPAMAQGPRFARFPSLPPATLPLTGGMPDSTARRPDELGMALGGLLAGVTGLVVGAYAGSVIDRGNGCSEWCGLWGGLVGATAGTTLMIPVGVHLSNRQRGSFGLDVGWSAVVAVAGWGTALAFDNATPLVILPFAQIVAAVASEAGSSRRAPE
jgi:hypothetical protein